MKVIDKVKDFGKKHKEEIAIGGGLGLMCATWYWAGAKWERVRIDLGLQKVFEADPELKERMWDAIGKVKGLKP